MPAPGASALSAFGTPGARAGILVMLAAMLIFAINDTLGKWLVATYSAGQVLLIRSLAALIVLAPFLMRASPRALLAPERPGLQALRVALSTLEVFCFYVAVSALPLADVLTYWMAAPIWVAALSPLVLGERIGWRRWSAIAVGFVGVLVALEPSRASISPAAGVCIVGSLAFAGMMLLSRVLRGTPDTTLVLWQTTGAGLAGLVLAPFAWVSPTPFDVGLLALLGVLSMLGHICVNRAFKLADAGTVVPYQYTLLLFAGVLGWLVFGDVPRPALVIGAMIIVGAGVYIFLRERQVARRAGRSARRALTRTRTRPAAPP
ncbi:DMT family transporter [Salinarimonas ramus]|uniref:Permease n=1 Tax=Salinarimonas ramus TaxID=690164 RepID=A0A917V2Q8_9HYPH|nr:DMT family transporter [Salinarimonas ramus]GGK25129.1 permease [Salinarimonas ramus]